MRIRNKDDFPSIVSYFSYAIGTKYNNQIKRVKQIFLHINIEFILKFSLN